MATISSLLVSAKRAVDASDARLREAAEYIAQARAAGASQDRIAKAVGKSQAWVSVLLRWRQDGGKGAPFGPRSRAARQAAQARTRTSTRVMGCCPGATITKPTAPEQVAKFEFQRARAQAVTAMFGATISNGLRAQLVAALTALPAEHPAERVRRRIGMSWDELVVAAAAESKRSAAA